MSGKSTELLNEVIQERHNAYGSYSEMASFVQHLKELFKESPQQWERYSSSQKESLDLICTKLGRLRTGDPNHVDTWRDIAGYAQLIVEQLENY